MGNLSAADFSTTVYARRDTEIAQQCDPFWTVQNGGYCSDDLGNYIRRDGSVVAIEELTGRNKPSLSLSDPVVQVGIFIFVISVVTALATRE